MTARNSAFNRCWKNCGVRVNAALAALVPAIDVLQSQLPMLREHLPNNIYAYAFVATAVINALLHIRVPK